MHGRKNTLQNLVEAFLKQVPRVEDPGRGQMRFRDFCNNISSKLHFDFAHSDIWGTQMHWENKTITNMEHLVLYDLE